MQDSDRPHVSSWTLNIPVSVSTPLSPTSFSTLSLKVSTLFWSTAKSTVLPMPHWGAVLTEDDVSRPRAEFLQHPLSPNQIWLPCSMEGSNHPNQAGGPWERRSLTSVKHRSVKAFLSRGASEHTGRWRGKTCPQHNQPPPSPTKRVQAADPPSTGCLHYTHCPSAPNHRLKCQTKRLRFGQTTLSVQTPTHPTSTSM